MAEFSIRRAQEDDHVLLPDIEALSDTLFDELPAFSWMTDYPNLSVDGYKTLPRGTTIWLAEIIDRAVGFIYAYDMDDCAYIGQLSVVPDAQGRGVGGALIEAVAAFSRNGNQRGLVLTTFRDIAWNAPFYAKRGFKTLTKADMGPELFAHVDEDRRKWSRFSPRVAMGRFF